MSGAATAAAISETIPPRSIGLMKKYLKQLAVAGENDLQALPVFAAEELREILVYVDCNRFIGG
jgi:uncharacterized protein (UPF0218 family)